MPKQLTIDSDELEISPIPQAFDLGDFDCGDADYNAYLSDGTALHDELSGVTRTYLVRYQDRIVGYYSILMDSITLLSKERKKTDIAYPSVPALKLGRLATDKTVQGTGLGQYLVSLVIKLARSLAQQVGCRYVTLDALPNRVPYYEDLGFVINKAVNKEKIERLRASNPNAELENVSMRFDLQKPEI